MQVTRAMGPGCVRAAAAALLALAAPAVRADEAPGTTDGSSLFRSFGDSKHVLVHSLVQDCVVPLRGDGRLTLHWNHERVTIPGVPATASATEAVDAITTASRPIAGDAYSDYTKVRNELESEYGRGGATVGYYHSLERDYLAHQLSLGYDRDVLGQQLNLAGGTSYGWDDIQPLANQRTTTGESHKNTLHGNLVATRIFTPTTVARFGLEWNHVTGLQHNPYRLVYAGGSSVPERHPETRERRDAFVKLHQYFENRSSVGLDYRLYDDDWGIRSHELAGSLSQYVTSGFYARWEYRWYTQTAADFWRPEYADVAGVDGFRTGDYRMGPLRSHLFGLSLHADLGTLAPAVRVLSRCALSLDVERYFNSNNYSADILETGVDVRF